MGALQAQPTWQAYPSPPGGVESFAQGFIKTNPPSTYLDLHLAGSWLRTNLE